MNLIECAIAREEQARADFASLAVASETSEQRTLFSLLGAAEDELLAELHALAPQALPATGGVEHCSFISLPPPDRLHRGGAGAGDGYRAITAVVEGYRDDYRQRATMTADPRLVQLCATLAAVEERHLATVEAIYAFVETPRTYLAWGEFANLRDM